MLGWMYKSGMYRRFAAGVCLLVVCQLTLVLWLPQASMGAKLPPQTEFGTGIAGETTYLEWEAKTASGFKDAAALIAPLVIPAVSYSAASDPNLFTADASGGLLWQDASSWIEYKLTVPESGLYFIGFVYDTPGQSGFDITRGVQINGAYPFDEAQYIQLKREFTQTISDDNSKVSKAIEIPGWKTTVLTDFSVHPTPLKWQLNAGENTIRIEARRDPLKLKEIFVQAPAAPPTYEEYAAKLPAPDKSGTWIKVIQAERFARKSDSSIVINNDKPSVTTLGGANFKRSGQYVEWEVDVPKDAMYEIGFKYKHTASNVYIPRAITVDGQYPFQELEEVRFAPDSSWQWRGYTVSDRRNAPFLLHLTAGKHIIRMTVSGESRKPVYEGLLRNLNKLIAIGQEVRQVTGLFDRQNRNLDLNRDWDIIGNIPDITERLQAMINDLNGLVALMQVFSVGRSTVETSFRSAIDDLEKFKERPNKIPNQLDVLEKISDNLASWTYDLIEMPLELDFLWVAEPGAKLPKVRPTFADNLGNFFQDFGDSFKSKDKDSGGDTQALEVWMNGRPRQYAELLQMMADESFTAQTGIKVQVKLSPDTQKLILSNLDGHPPDVALGVEEKLPIEYGMRGGLVDLGQFPDYAEVAKPFNPGALRALHYDGKDYALPETQDFSVMIYRTDILGSLGLTPPDTWDDVIKMLPVLQQNGYNFYISPSDYQTFLYQNGADLYSPDGMQSGLSDEKAYKGFREWTDFLTLYQLPIAVPSVFNRFRVGDLPIGVMNSTDYMQIAFAAPELARRWKMLPIPGTKQPDGTVARWSGGPLSAAVMFNKSDKQQQAWQFLKWWTSAETQAQFMTDIEARNGSSTRWNSANMAAYANSPWPKEDVATIMEQWKWYKEAPNVPGGYATERMIGFAFSSVIGKANPREAFEKAIDDINLELTRKQIEFGLRDKQGNILNRLDIAPLTAPWKGVSP